MQFQRYVNRLRSKKTDYKTKSQELAQLKAECGVLVRTEEILKQRFESVSNNLVRTYLNYIFSLKKFDLGNPYKI